MPDGGDQSTILASGFSKNSIQENFQYTHDSTTSSPTLRPTNPTDHLYLYFLHQLQDSKQQAIMPITTLRNHHNHQLGPKSPLTSENLGKLLNTLPQPYETMCYKYRPGDETFTYEESDDGCPPLSYSTNLSTRSNTTATSSFYDSGLGTPATQYSSGPFLDVPKNKKHAHDENEDVTSFLLDNNDHNGWEQGPTLVAGIPYYEEEEEEDEEDEHQKELERRFAARMEAERQVELALARQQNALEAEEAEKVDRERSTLEDISDDDADELFDDIESFAKENREKAKAHREAMISALDYTDEGFPAVRWILKQREPFARSPMVTWDFKHAPRQPTIVDDETLEAERAVLPAGPTYVKGPWLTSEPLLMEEESLFEPYTSRTSSTSGASSVSSTASTAATEFSVSASTMAEATDALVGQVFKFLAMDQETESARFDDELAYNNRWPQKYVAENRFAALKDYIQRYIERNPKIAKGDALW